MSLAYGQRIMARMSDELWPALPYDAWKDTYATLQMWMQVVGRVALAQAAPVNHSWAIAMQVTTRGLSTRALTHGRRTFSIEFDFIDHQLVIQVSDRYGISHEDTKTRKHEKSNVFRDF